MDIVLVLEIFCISFLLPLSLFVFFWHSLLNLELKKSQKWKSLNLFIEMKKHDYGNYDKFVFFLIGVLVTFTGSLFSLNSLNQDWIVLLGSLFYLIFGFFLGIHLLQNKIIIELYKEKDKRESN